VAPRLTESRSLQDAPRSLLSRHAVMMFAIDLRSTKRSFLVIKKLQNFVKKHYLPVAPRLTESHHASAIFFCIV
jgi:hypothetical protein